MGGILSKFEKKVGISEVISYDPSESYAMSCAPIFHEDNCAMAKRDDAVKVISALVDNGMIPPENTYLLEANSCTSKRMKKYFQQHVEKVGPNGIFFFHFCGHGKSLLDTSHNHGYGLKAYGFRTFVTASDIHTWLNEVYVRAKRIIISIDCCFSGGLAEELMIYKIPSMYGITSCLASERATVFHALESTFFTYCFSYAIRCAPRSENQFPVGNIFHRSKKLTAALTSLLVTYDKVGMLEVRTMHPSLFKSQRRFSELRDDMDETPPEENEIHTRHSFARSLLDTNGGAVELHQLCNTWIQNNSTRHIRDLNDEGILDDHVTTTVLYCMMYSVASMQLVHDPHRVNYRNLSITVFFKIVEAIDTVKRGVTFSERKFHLGLCHYRDSLICGDISVEDVILWIDSIMIQHYGSIV